MLFQQDGRVTALDGLYPKGTANATNPNDTGGNATHTHTSSSHTHTMSAHTHSIDIKRASTQDSHNVNGGSTLVEPNHDHTAFNSGAITSVSVGSTSVTYSEISNDPPYYEVIFITPTTGTDVLPNGVIYFYDGSDTKNRSLSL